VLRIRNFAGSRIGICYHITSTDSDLDLNPDPNPDPSISKQKKKRKKFISAVLWPENKLLLLKTVVNVRSLKCTVPTVSTVVESVIRKNLSEN
jgi:hypothetical protein